MAAFREGGSSCHGTSPLVTILLPEAREFPELCVSQQGAYPQCSLMPLLHPPQPSTGNQTQTFSNRASDRTKTTSSNYGPNALAKRRAPVYILPISAFHISSFSHPIKLHPPHASQTKHPFNQNAVQTCRYPRHFRHTIPPPHHD